MPTRIGSGMCVSVKQRRPTADSISQGLHASDVSCAHHARNVGQRQNLGHEQPLVQILVVVANIQMRTLKGEKGKGSM